MASFKSPLIVATVLLAMACAVPAIAAEAPNDRAAEVRNARAGDNPSNDQQNRRRDVGVTRVEERRQVVRVAQVRPASVPELDATSGMIGLGLLAALIGLFRERKLATSKT